MSQSTDFAETFARLAREGVTEETSRLGGVNVRCVRIAGGGPGKWDSHPTTTETVVVWSGDFSVEFRGEQTLTLSAGQCCVVPIGVEHRGTSTGGADVVLFQQAP
ncbi:MAG: cupin domain-containing protein [Acetobacteraceae bacterium]|nr:cupin domain-containing protein [Acetobacteraceae bacterium]